MRGLFWALRAAFLKKRGEYRHYRLDYAVGLGLKLMFFLTMLWAYPGLPPAQQSVRIYGFLLWYLAAHLLAKMSNLVLEEAYLGTWEQILSSRTSLWAFLLAQGMAEIVLSLVWVLPFSLIAAALTPFWQAWHTLGWTNWLHWAGLTLLTLTALLGLGVGLFGISIRYKQIGSLSELLIFALLFFSGFFFPVNQLPLWARPMIALSPLYWAVRGAQALLLQGQGPILAWQALLLHAVGWGLIGSLVTRFYWHWALRQGTLTRY